MASLANNGRELNDETTILSQDGVVMGIKNRVKTGMAAFEENGKTTEKRQTDVGKIIVYTTSFRGVRSTYDDCKYITTIFTNHRVKYEERDVYMTQSFHHELEERLIDVTEGEIGFSVPQVFINGEYIGGKEEIEELNETGELKIMLKEFPRVSTVKSCQICGGFEFIPCLKCGGSKNSVAINFTSEFRALKCTSCNENGLRPCPHCNLTTN